MSPITRNILRGVDYDAVMSRRNENFAVLESLLGAYNRLSPALSNGPYCYPFYCADGMSLKRQLAQRKIYVATLWPNVLSDPASTELERDLTQNILPLPCDQRYTADDMRYMAQTLLDLMNL